MLSDVTKFNRLCGARELLTKLAVIRVNDHLRIVDGHRNLG